MSNDIFYFFNVRKTEKMIRIILTLFLIIFLFTCQAQSLQHNAVNHLFVVCDLEFNEIIMNGKRLVQGFADDGLAILFLESNPPFVIMKGTWTILNDAIWVHWGGGQTSAKFYSLENTEHLFSIHETLINIGAFK